MAALLTADADNTDRVVIEISECRSMGIEVLPPDVNESLAHFTVVDDKTIRFGLTAIKGIGEGPVHEIIEARKKMSLRDDVASTLRCATCVDEKFKNLEDFARRVPAKVLNKKAIQSFAYSGAMGDLGERKQLAESYEEISKYAKNIQASVADGQTDIFGMMDDSDVPKLKLANVEKAEASERLTWEKEFLGLYVSGHPLQGLKSYFSTKGKLIGNLTRDSLNKKVKISGLISQYRRVMTKAGKYMCFGEIEDPSARISFVLFPRTYDEFGEAVEPDRIVSVEGKLDKRSDQYQIIVETVKPLSLESMLEKAKASNSFDADEKIIGVPAVEFEEEVKSTGLAGPYVIELPANSDPEILHKIKPILESRKGDTPVEIHIPAGKSLKRVKVPFGVNLDKDLKEQLKEFTMPQS